MQPPGGENTKSKYLLHALTCRFDNKRLTSFQVPNKGMGRMGLHKKRLPLLTEKQDALETEFRGWTKVVNINEEATIRKTGRPLKTIK